MSLCGNYTLISLQSPKISSLVMSPSSSFSFDGAGIHLVFMMEEDSDSVKHISLSSACVSNEALSFSQFVFIEMATDECFPRIYRLQL
mgnify:CR=1 FL=1